jgi:hypothetical protein
MVRRLALQQQAALHTGCASIDLTRLSIDAGLIALAHISRDAEQPEPAISQNQRYIRENYHIMIDFLRIIRKISSIFDARCGEANAD